MSKRVEQLNELIKHNLAEIIQKELEFPLDTMITVTNAAVTPDLMQAKIWTSVLPDAKGSEIIRELNAKKKYIAHLLGQKTNLRKIPKIDFLLDTTEMEAAGIEKLLNEEEQ